MEQYIPKSALVAEIERRILEDYNTGDKEKDAVAQGAIASLKYYIEDTLEVKEVDLEKETKKWWKERLHLNPENQLWMDAHQSVVFAKHFFELGMSVNNKAQKGE